MIGRGESSIPGRAQQPDNDIADFPCILHDQNLERKRLVGRIGSHGACSSIGLSEIHGLFLCCFHAVLSPTGSWLSPMNL